MSTISGKSTLVVIFLCSLDECSNLIGENGFGGHPTTLLRTGWPKDRVQKMSPFQVEGQRQSFPYVQTNLNSTFSSGRKQQLEVSASSAALCSPGESCTCCTWVQSVVCMMSRHFKIPGYLDIIAWSHT